MQCCGSFLYRAGYFGKGQKARKGSPKETTRTTITKGKTKSRREKREREREKRPTHSKKKARHYTNQKQTVGRRQSAETREKLSSKVLNALVPLDA
jgi:hypothetical protein